MRAPISPVAPFNVVYKNMKFKDLSML